MEYWFIKAIIFITIVITLGFFTTIFRRPYTSTKISYGLFGVALILWNLNNLVVDWIIKPSFSLHYLHSFLSMFTFYLGVVFALHFPFYRRRESRLNHYVSFIGGIGYLILIQTLCVPLIEEYYPIESRFFLKINEFLYRAFTFLCILSFTVIIFFNLSNTIKSLKRFLYRALTLLSVITGFIISYNYSYRERFNLFSTDIPVEFIDMIYLSILGYAIYYFRFIGYYPSLLSYFIMGEYATLVIQKVEPASREGAQSLKDYLWRIYESENWRDFVDEFWFNIVIDETIDNALEHGGKRSYDVITVCLYESPEYLDLYVKDMGKGFEPSGIPDPRLPERKTIPTGRGIHILKKLYNVKWNFIGNEIRVRIPKNQEMQY
ncbi:MAG: ATP-binding protein [Leptospiraceae bacterium]|nr:ATP-binding protein [Leptospiraceae bacterium]MCP5502471.1 ATP-binding protein [Leptospiraceae bacterium]